MSYKQKCLAVDPGLRCKSVWNAFLYQYMFEILIDGKVICEFSAAAAWKATWERLREEVPG